ncbi:MAG: hypothetical protein ACFFE8_03935 [Candidatus Heimdallarchaeota archaeon]
MDQERLEHLYVTGEYPTLLDELHNLGYNKPSTNLTEFEVAICFSYHIRTLIRIGKTNEAERLHTEIPKIQLDDSFSITDLVHLTTLLNLKIERGKISDAIRKGLRATRLLEIVEANFSRQSENLSIWGGFLYYLIGMAYQHQGDWRLADGYFQKTLDLNQISPYIRAKSLYYMAFLVQAREEFTERGRLLEESLDIFKTIGAKQGMAWIYARQGQALIVDGDIPAANNKYNKALKLFKSIGDVSGVNAVNIFMSTMF